MLPWLICRNLLLVAVAPQMPVFSYHPHTLPAIVPFDELFVLRVLTPNFEGVGFGTAGAAVGRASVAGAADCCAPAVDAAGPRASASFDSGDSSISFVTVGLYGIGGGVIGCSWE